MFDNPHAYFYFSQEVIHQNRFVLSKKSESFINEFKTKIHEYKATINTGSIFVRAQKGNSFRDLIQDDVVIDKIPCAFSSERMKPLKDQAKEGRVNPKGIPYLYLSSDEKTAISEVRPWIGDTVSVGFFEIIKDLVLVHFTDDSVNHVFYLNGPPKEKYDELVWKDINRAFSKPISDDERTAEYIPTQYLAEIIKTEGFNGIVYKSRAGEGQNISLFDLDYAELFECYLVEIEKYDISYHQIDGPYRAKK